MFWSNSTTDQPRALHAPGQRRSRGPGWRGPAVGTGTPRGFHCLEPGQGGGGGDAPGGSIASAGLQLQLRWRARDTVQWPGGEECLAGHQSSQGHGTLQSHPRPSVFSSNMFCSDRFPSLLGLRLFSSRRASSSRRTIWGRGSIVTCVWHGIGTGRAEMPSAP